MTRIPFILLSTTDGSPITGAAPTVTISKDGVAFIAATNTPDEIGNGYYYIDLTTAETTVDYNVVIKVASTGAQPVSLIWEPDVDLSDLIIVRSLLDKWSIQGSKLVCYDKSGNILESCTLTTDSDGEIIAVTPDNN